MTNYTMFGNPGTPLFASAQAAVTVRRGAAMRWSAVGSCTSRRRDHGLRGRSAGSVFIKDSVFVKTVERAAAANGQAYVRVITDLPTIKQFRVPSSLWERSP